MYINIIYIYICINMYKYGFRETTVVLFRKFLHHMFFFTNFVLRHKRFSPDVGVSKNWVFIEEIPSPFKVGYHPI